MSNAGKNIVIGLVCLIVGIISGVWIRSCKPQEPIEPVIIRDTLTVTDTAYIIEHTKPIKVLYHDTMWVHIPNEYADTIIEDTIPIDIPITQYQYRDTFTTDTSNIELGVTFSGYKAKIDSVSLNYNFEVQPRIVEKKKGWGQFVGVGVGAGYGICIPNSTVYAGPEIGIHIVYGFGYHW